MWVFYCLLVASTIFINNNIAHFASVNSEHMKKKKKKSHNKYLYMQDFIYYDKQKIKHWKTSSVFKFIFLLYCLLYINKS